MSDGYAKAYYPVFLDLNGRLAVVVGGGKVAERKAATLAEYGADVVVIAPETTERILEMESEGLLTIERRGYVRGDLENAFVVICATDSEEVNRAVYAEADERGCLVNVVDVPSLCNFIVPSIVKRGGLQIAISTGGAAPAVAKRVRRKVAEDFGDDWADYIRLMGEVRALVMARVPEQDRMALFERIADSDLRERMAAGAVPTAEDVVKAFRGAG